MTLPRERTQALHNTREFLRSLLDSKATPRVPLDIRRRARWCLKHFPSDYDLYQASKKYWDVFETPELKKD